MPSVYLVADSEEPASLQELIDLNAADIFEDQLEGWHTDEGAWPRNRSPHVFRDWFDVTLSGWVVDLDSDLVPGQEDGFDDEENELDDEDDELIEGLRGGPGSAIACAWCGGRIDHDGRVVTLTLKGPSRPAQTTTEVVELEVAGRMIPAIVPPDESPAAREGAMALVMFCGTECAGAFEEAWHRERGAPGA